MITSILFTFTIVLINLNQNEALLDIEHPYEVLNFDRSVLSELKLHRKRRSIELDDELEQEVDRRWKRDLESVSFDDYDRHLKKHDALHMYSKLPADEFDLKLKNVDKPPSDDDLFRRHNLRNRIKQETLNEKLNDRHFKLNFNAHKREFKLLLKSKHNNDVFAPNVEFESTKGRFNYDKDNIINGFLEDEKGSYIDGIVEGIITHDGLIDGMIRTNDNEEYYIEPARNYINRDKLKDDAYRNKTKDFHSIIYKLSDLTFPNSTCKHHYYEHSKERRLAKRQTSDEANSKQTKNDSSIKPLPYTNSSIEPDQLNIKYLEGLRKNSVATGGKKPVKKPTRPQHTNNHKFYWKELDALHYNGHYNSEAYGVRAISRTHWTSDIEQQSHLVVDSRKSTCMLYLQADHLFYNRMGSEESCVETMIRHVQKVNSIYRVTDFDQDGKPDNISFLIKRIKVHTTDALQDNEYRFPSNYGVERFLELFSEEDYDAFCLAYMFTYRDFEGGTLGLAWTGDLKNAGGVCEKNGHYRGSLKSLNTGIVTLLNYGKHVPPIVSHVTLAHEIGHNFGSAHDPEDDGMCTPGGENGNYIMYARATSGDKKNNNKFSPCSLKSVNAVLNTKARSLKGCFQEPQEAICGNGVVEANEQCDCGWEESCTEPCCYPQKNNPPANEVPCTLRPGFVCSPSQGPCCTHDTCRLKVGNKCRDDNGCRTASYCSGQGPTCPPSVNKPNKTICNEESVCYMGECTGSICIAYGLESCQCKRKEGVDNKRGDPLCELCCRLPASSGKSSMDLDSTCKSSFEWNSPPYDVPDLLSKPGTPCDDYRGYCDVNQICREVHPTGLGFIKYLLSDQSISIIRNWVQHQWILAGLLCCIAFVLCALLLRALHKAQKQRETCKSASNLLGTGLLSNIGNIANNPIATTGFLPASLFGHSTATNPPVNSSASGLQSTDSNTGAYTNPINPYDSTTYVTGNANYSNAYGYTPIANTQQQPNVQQPAYADYGLTSNASLVSNTAATTADQQTTNSTSLIDSIYGGASLKSNQTTAYLNNQPNQPTYTSSPMNSVENDVKSLANNYNTPINLNSSPAQYLTNNLTNNLSSNLSTRQPYSQFQSNYSSYNNSNHLVNRQKRLPNNGAIKNLSSAIGASSSYNKPNTSSSANSSSSSSSRLNKNYSKNSSLNNFNNNNNFAGQSYSASSTQQMNQQSNYQPNYQTTQQQPFFQQPAHHLNRANSTSTATEYGHAPLSLPNNQQWL